MQEATLWQGVQLANLLGDDDFFTLMADRLDVPVQCITNDNSKGQVRSLMRGPYREGFRWRVHSSYARRDVLLVLYNEYDIYNSTLPLHKKIS